MSDALSWKMIRAATLVSGLCLCASAPAWQDDSMTLDSVLGEAPGDAGDEGKSLLDALGENLRINLDYVSRFETTSRRSELGLMNAIGFDIRKVFSGDEGDLGVAVLQPYVVRRDNIYERFIPIDGNDAFVYEWHDFYFNLTRFFKGRMNFKVGHFDVPFGLEPNVDTHFTLRQFTPMHDAGFKKDWGFSLNGALEKIDYEVALTNGTGQDLSDQGQDTYLISSRIGTPAEENFAIGVSGLYGEIVDEHGIHRLDEGDPFDTREEGGFVRRWRVGVDATQILGQFTLRGQASTGEDFEDEVFNAIAELGWTTPDEDLFLYIQGIYLGQDGSNLGWDQDVRTRLGARWQLNPVLALSAQWTHEFETWTDQLGDEHSHEDTYLFQVRLRF